MSLSFSTQDARAVGPGLLSPAGSVQDAELAAALRGYKKAIASRYRALTREEIPSLGRGPLQVTPKLDGELWFLVFATDGPWLAAPNGKVLSGPLPLLVEAQAAAARVQPGTVLCGELFAARTSGRPRVGDLAAAMGGEAEAAVERLGFAAFDVLRGGAVDGPTMVAPAWADRHAALVAILGEGGKRMRPIRCRVASEAAEVTAAFDEWVGDGKGEGLVVRGPDEIIYKVKPSISLDAAVIGYTESSEGPDKVGSLLLALVRDDGQFQLIGSVGNMPTELRVELLPELAAAVVPSTFRHANHRGALYRFVAPQHVVEIKITDLQAEDSAGDPIARMVLDHGAGGWVGLRELPGVSILHPVLVRRRPDKKVDATDVRFAQVEERCIVPDRTRHAERPVLPPSEIVRREVYTKVTKGETAVRKLVVWKTNKDASLQPRYPAFVVHFTDYSAGRKEPLQREVRLAHSISAAQEIADQWVGENVKKGWNRAG